MAPQVQDNTPRWVGKDWLLLLALPLLSIFGVALIFGVAVWKSFARSDKIGLNRGSRLTDEDSASPDIMSSLLPDRPIRPLPKRRLRERLSPDVADAIEYPPAPQGSSHLFYYPYSLRDDEPGTGVGRDRVVEQESRHGRRNGVTADGGGEESGGRRAASGRLGDMADRTGRLPPRPEFFGRHQNSTSLSANSSLDGYDAFENTNKKKRKIPTISESLLNRLSSVSGDSNQPTSLLNDPPKEPADLPVPANSVSSGVQNVAGPGRGRYGRVRNGRSILAALSPDSTNRSGKPITSSSENTGIISSAIAKAEKLPVQQGQENISLLQRQQQPAKTTPASSQFTFTCDSQVPGSLSWPVSHQKGNMASNLKGPNWPERRAPPPSAPQLRAPPPKPDPDAAKKAQRRQEKREFHNQARARMRAQQKQNKLNPPDPDDKYICPACEYESIMGVPPYFLLEKYERKAQQERRAQEERKANAAKRLNKQGGKKPAKSAAARNQPAPSAHFDDGLDEEPEFFDNDFPEGRKIQYAPHEMGLKCIHGHTSGHNGDPGHNDDPGTRKNGSGGCMAGSSRVA